MARVPGSRLVADGSRSGAVGQECLGNLFLKLVKGPTYLLSLKGTKLEARVEDP